MDIMSTTRTFPVTFYNCVYMWTLYDINQNIKQRNKIK